MIIFDVSLKKASKDLKYDEGIGTKISHWNMICLMINVHKCSLHIRQDFEILSWSCCYIVCFPRGVFAFNDDVRLHEIVGATLIANLGQFVHKFKRLARN